MAFLSESSTIEFEAQSGTVLIGRGMIGSDPTALDADFVLFLAFQKFYSSSTDRPGFGEFILVESQAMSTQSLDVLLLEVAARTASPGGGAVSALAIAFGAALAVMVVRFSLQGDVSLPRDKEQGIGMDADIGASLRDAEAKLLGLMHAAKELVDEDARAYEQYLEASRDSEASRGRQAEVQARLVRACEVPFEAVSTARNALEILAMVVDHSKPKLASDLLTGANLLRTGAEAASLNVVVNTASLKDRELADKMVVELRHNEADLQASFKKVQGTALAMLGV